MAETQKYANDKGLKIIGDIPIYVAYDSADVWAHPEMFQLDQGENPPQLQVVLPMDFLQTDSCGAIRCIAGIITEIPAMTGG